MWIAIEVELQVGNGVSPVRGAEEDIGILEPLALYTREEDPTEAEDEDKRLNRRATVDAFEATDDEFIVGYYLVGLNCIPLVSTRLSQSQAAFLSIQMDIYRCFGFCCLFDQQVRIGSLLFVVKIDQSEEDGRERCAV